jgi:hypothetical protein
LQSRDRVKNSLFQYDRHYSSIVISACLNLHYYDRFVDVIIVASF